MHGAVDEPDACAPLCKNPQPASFVFHMPRLQAPALVTSAPSMHLVAHMAAWHLRAAQTAHPSPASQDTRKEISRTHMPISHHRLLTLTVLAK